MAERGAIIRVALAITLVTCSCDKNPSRPMLRPQACPTCLSESFTLVDYPYDISPNDSFVVYGHVGTSDLAAGVYVVGVSPGSEPKYLMPYVHPAYFDPWGLRFSPDGTRLSYVRGGTGDVFILDLESMQERQVTFTYGNAQAGDWDPSGRYLVYERPFLSYGAPDTSAGIFIVDTETLSDTPLLHEGHPTYGGQARWSPDSTRIAFYYGIGSPSYALHIFTVKVDGTEYQDLMPSSPNNADSEEWLHEDGRIIYESYDPSSFNIHDTRVVDPKTREVRRWPADLRLMVNHLSRDGAYYVFTYPDSAGYGVVYMQETRDATGVTRRQITRVGAQ